MATVYLARDRKHDRRVAVKVLHAELAAVLGTERFLREIRVTATLQHPHILGLIDSGVFGDEAGELRSRPYYVMPYIQGESLRQRLEREGQLSVADAVRIAGEVASALDYAHRHGVIHRDVKPENILLHDGSALVADFGIALAVQQAGGARMTQTGLSLGTPQYMSPEQATGERTITARSDVYALGAVAYEMLAGEPPFTGPSIQAIVARLMAEPPRPLTAQRRSVPPHVEAAILKALEKVPADRFDSAAQFGAALTNPSFTTGSTPAPPPAIVRRPAAAWLPWTVAALAVTGLVVSQPWSGRTVVRPPVRRVSIVLPADAAWERDANSSIALSRDGSVLAYNGIDSTGQRRLYLRAIGRDEPVPISGSETAHFPSFSADGRWVAFVLNSRIVRARIAGGAPETLCDVGGLPQWTWLDDGSAVFVDATGVKRCSTTGEVTSLLAADSTRSFSFPHALPGSDAALLTTQRGTERRLAVLDLRTRVLASLDIPGSDGRWVDAGDGKGFVVYASADGPIRAVAFDPTTRAVNGEPLTLAESIHVDGAGRAIMAISRDGSTMVAAPRSAFARALVLVDRHGDAVPVHARLDEFADPRFSPDGNRIAFSLATAIWQLDRAQGTLTRISFDTGTAERPAWSPDGKRLAYVRRIGPRNEIRVIAADGGAPPTTLVDLPGLEPWHVLFTPDQRSVLVRTVGTSGKRDILSAALDSSRRVRPLLASPADEVSPTLSPDGRWLAYASNESGRYEIYVRSFPDMTARTQVSLGGGNEPAWSPRGDEVFFRTGPTLMSAHVSATTTFTVLRREAVFSSPDFTPGATYQNYDVAPDGQHFIMVRNVGGADYLSLTLHRFVNLATTRAPARD